MRVLLDTNLLLRLEDLAHPQHDLAVDSISSLITAKHECVLVPQVLYEFWAVATRPIPVNGLGFDTARADQAISDWLGAFRILLDESQVFRNWYDLVVKYDVKGKTAHDARLVAAMQRHGMMNLLTFNGADFARFATINIYSPAEILAGRLPA